MRMRLQGQAADRSLTHSVDNQASPVPHLKLYASDLALRIAGDREGLKWGAEMGSESTSTDSGAAQLWILLSIGRHEL